MTNKEFWLRLFAENDTALAAAIHFCQRFTTEESLIQGRDFLAQKRKELYEEADPAIVALLRRPNE